MTKNSEATYDPLETYRSASDMPWEGKAAAQSSINLGDGTVLESRTLRVGWGSFGRLVSDFRFINAETGEVVDDKKA